MVLPRWIKSALLRLNLGPRQVIYGIPAKFPAMVWHSRAARALALAAVVYGDYSTTQPLPRGHLVVRGRLVEDERPRAGEIDFTNAILHILMKLQYIITSTQKR